MDKQFRDFAAEGERAGMRYALSVPRNALTGMTGVRLGRMAGTSLDFKDHREYQPGDDLRTIDWGAYARSDKLTVKLYREEVTPHLDLVLDCSRSMALEGTEKARACVGLAAVLATAAANARCSHCAWMAADGVVRVGNGTDRPGAWDGLGFDHAENPAACFEIMPPAWRRNGIRVLVSDLLWIGEPMRLLRRLADGASSAWVIQVLGAAETKADARGNVRVSDVETGGEIEVFVDAAVEQRYAEALARHRQNWLDACRRTGVSLVTVVAEEVCGNWSMTPLEKSGMLDAS